MTSFLKLIKALVLGGSIFFTGVTALGSYVWFKELVIEKNGKMLLDWEPTFSLVFFTISGGIFLSLYFYLIVFPQSMLTKAYYINLWAFLLSSVLFYYYYLPIPEGPKYLDDLLLNIFILFIFLSPILAFIIRNSWKNISTFFYPKPK